MYLRNCWYVAGWNYEFEAGALTARTLLNEPIVFYRKADGGWVALADRCLHRFAPLSRGRLEGDDLRCLYHGLKFAPDGRCIEIPGQDAVPETACLKRYPVAEKHSWVWVWMGDPALADEDLIPPAIGLDDPAWTFGSGQLDYEANYRLINDNLLDFTHLTYVHANSFGAGPEWAYTRPNITRLDRGVRVERWVEQPNSVKSRPAMRPDEADGYTAYDFLLPGVLLMRSASYPKGTAAALDRKPPPADMAPLTQTFTSQAVTPITDETSRYFFSWGPPAGEGSRELADTLMGIAGQAFAEDKAIIEAQAAVIRRTGEAGMMATTADAALFQFRRIMDRLIAAEAEPARSLAAVTDR